MYSHVSKLAEKAVMAARTSSTSDYSWKKLSPHSQDIRWANIVKEGRDYAKQANKVFDITG